MTDTSGEAFPAKAARSLIAIRCHRIDDDLIRMARALGAGEAYDVVLALDARADVPEGLDAATVRISHAAFTDQLGLFCPEDALWRCGDYTLFAVRRQRPGYRFYWMIEYDVLIARENILSFFAEIDAKLSHDLLSAIFRAVAEPDWWWTKYVSDYFPAVSRSFFPLVRFSAAALDHLHEARRDFFSRHEAHFRAHPFLWPNDEAFAASQLISSGFSGADFNEGGAIYYGQDTFEYETIRHPSECDPKWGVLFHPVRRGLGFVQAARKHRRNWDHLTRALLADAEGSADQSEIIEKIVEDALESAWDRPQRLLAPDSRLSTLLALRADEATLLCLTNAFGRFRMPDCLYRLRALARQNGWPLSSALLDVALAKPAAQSSICQWSNQKHLLRDAEGANSGEHARPYGFHTDKQDKPWWRVDLKHLHAIDRIRIVNRQGAESAERLRGFVLRASTDELEWTQVYGDPGGEGAREDIEIVFPEPFPARFLSVELPRNGILHFRQFQAFGTRTEDDAPHPA